MPKARSLKSNIWKNYLLLFTQGFWFILPIFQVYYIFFGLDYLEMGTLEGSASAIFFILTIPCGAFSDLVSRKASIFIGSLLTAVAMLITGLVSTYALFLFSYAIWSVADSFLYNARRSMMYDTVKQIGREDEYLQISGRANIFTVLPLLFSGFMGPILYSINPRLPWLLISGLWFLSVIIVLFMVEPKKEKQEYTFKNYMKKIGDGLRFIVKEKHVLWMLFFSIAMTVPLAVFNEVISQSYFYEIGFLEKHMKWIFPTIYGIASLTASQSHRIEKWIGETGSFIFIIIVHSIGLLLMGLLQTPYAIIVVMITYISRDFRWVFGDSYINKYSQSGIRTTIMSIITMAIALVMSFSYTLGGLSVDYFGIHPTLLILGAFTICVSILLVITKPKNKKKIEEL
ncbi:MAG: MFS transporter [Promethearchaeota archaeon]